MSNWEKTMKEWDDSIPDGIKYLSAEKQVLMRRVRELESENARVEPERPERKWKTGHPEHPEKVLVLARYDYPNEYFVEYEIDKWDFTHNRWSEDERIRTVLGWCEIPEFDLEVTEYGHP